MTQGTPTQSVSGSLEQALARGAELLETSPDAALQQAQAILRKDGREPRALRLAAAAHRGRGEPAFAERAELMAIDEARRYPLLTQAAQAIERGEFPKASELAASHLKEFGGDLAALTLSAESALGIGLADKAIPLLQSVLKRAPAFAHARIVLVNALMLSDQLREAKSVLNGLLKQSPDSLSLLTLWGRVMNGLGDFDEGIDTTARLIELKPSSPDYHADHADALRFVGHRDRARDSYRKALQIDPAHARSWWSLADLDAKSVTDGDIATISEQLAVTGLSDESAVNLHFALALALHDRADYDEAFAHFAAGNAKRNAADPFESDTFHEEIGKQAILARNINSSTQLESKVHSPVPLFIVGMPRAGSTLLERMLAQHGAIEALGELQIVPHMARRIEVGSGKDGAPDAIAALAPPALASMGNWYRNRVRELMQSDSAIIVDKMHMNWRHIPLILRILPDAKIIDIRRNAMDCCWSNYRTLFSTGHPAANDLTDIGGFYRTYAEFTDALRAEYPDRIMLIEFEQLVDNPTDTLRDLTDFLSIPFDRTMLDFHESAGPVATASSEQVRQPLNRKGIGAWKAYSDHLAPLRDALGDMARD